MYVLYCLYVNVLIAQRNEVILWQTQDQKGMKTHQTTRLISPKAAHHMHLMQTGLLIKQNDK